MEVNDDTNDDLTYDEKDGGETSYDFLMMMVIKVCSCNRHCYLNDDD